MNSRGQKSFAGSHVTDDEHQLTLLDVSPYKEGMMPPALFLNLFKDSKIDTLRLLHYGPINNDFYNLVRKGILSGMTFEGVVAKTYNKRKRIVEMFKIKSDTWLNLAKEKYKDNPKFLEEIM